MLLRWHLYIEMTPVLGDRHNTIINLLANGSIAFIWKLHCRRSKRLSQCQFSVVIQNQAMQSLDVFFAVRNEIRWTTTRKGNIPLMVKVNAQVNKFLWIDSSVCKWWCEGVGLLHSLYVQLQISTNLNKKIWFVLIWILRSVVRKSICYYTYMI